MQLTTERLLLRPLNQTDAEAYVRLSADSGFLMYQISNYRRATAAEAAQWIQLLRAYHERNGFGIVGVFDRNGDALLGLAALKYLGEERSSPVELMYRLRRDAWGQGYGTEIGRCLLDYAFNSICLQKIVATVDPQNLASKNVLKNLGFEFYELISIEGISEEIHEIARTAFTTDQVSG